MVTNSMVLVLSQRKVSSNWRLLSHLFLCHVCCCAHMCKINVNYIALKIKVDYRYLQIGQYRLLTDYWYISNCNCYYIISIDGSIFGIWNMQTDIGTGLLYL